ncbi:MAG: GNAT family N-acetyltransferase [Aquincola sp.]|nr:GNAT family N-acetyltransferase [Aquincola sp.]MDH5329927.1 GNAT family N-acetyltransferase [Aquincola sp.]
MLPTIRRLAPDDAAAFKALRLAGLLDLPSAFGSSHAEECDTPLAELAQRLAPAPDCAVFGAFERGQLLGLAGLRRERMAKAAHKAVVWGMYVAPHARRRSIGRALLAAAIELARSAPGLLQVNLSVNADNTAALALYESAGFRAYGRERGALLVDGVLHDEILMSLSLRENP